MAVVVLKKWKVEIHDGPTLYLYSDADLSVLDILMRRTKKISPMNEAGLGGDGQLTFDGRPLEKVESNSK